MLNKIVLLFILTLLFSCSNSDDNSIPMEESSMVSDDNDEDEDEVVINTIKTFKKAAFFFQGELSQRHERYFDEHKRISSYVEQEVNFSYDSIVFSYPNTVESKASGLTVYSVNENSDDYITTYNYEYGVGTVAILIELFNSTTNMTETSEFKYEISFHEDYVDTFNKLNFDTNEVYWTHAFEYNAASNCTKFTFANLHGGTTTFEQTRWDSGKIRDPLEIYPSGIEDSFLLFGTNLKTSKNNVLEYMTSGQIFKVDYVYDDLGNIIEHLGSTYEYIEL